MLIVVRSRQLENAGYEDNKVRHFFSVEFFVRILFYIFMQYL